MKKKYSNGFSLIELLVFLAIIGVLGALAIPSFFETQKRNQLSQMTEGIQAQAQLALQEAKTFNQPVILIWWGTEDRWPEGLQRGKIENQQWIPLAKEWIFPEEVEFYLEEGYSTLLEVLKSQNLDNKLTAYKKPLFKIIEFYPSGRIDIGNTDAYLNNELTLTMGLKNDLENKEFKKMIFYSIHQKTGEFLLIDFKN